MTAAPVRSVADLTLEEICEDALAFNKDVTDIHLDVNLPPTYVIRNEYTRLQQPIITKHTFELAKERLSDAARQKFIAELDADGRFTLDQGQTVRFHLYTTENGGALALRIQPKDVRPWEETGLSSDLLELLKERQGLVIFSGPIGSGKTSAMHSMLRWHNEHGAPGHIYTIEDPPEYSHVHKNSIFHQREIGVSAKSYTTALEGCMRVRPSVILIGEMRRVEEMDAAIQMISLGHLAMTSVHSHDTSKTVLRILQTFDPRRYNEVKEALRNHLLAVINVRLVPTIDGKMTTAAEIMLNHDSVRNNLDSPEKVMMLRDVIASNTDEGMQTLEYDLARLENHGVITPDVAWHYAIKKDDLLPRLKSKPSHLK